MIIFLRIKEWDMRKYRGIIFSALLLALLIVTANRFIVNSERLRVKKNLDTEVNTDDVLSYDRYIQKVEDINRVKAEKEAAAKAQAEKEAIEKQKAALAKASTDEKDSKNTVNVQKPKNESVKKQESKQTAPTKKQETKQTETKKETSKPKATPVKKPETTAETGGTVSRDLSVQMFNSINQQRKSAGVKELVWSESHYNAAVIRANEIVEKFSHTRPNGKKWNTVNQSILHGENLAKGHRSVESAMNGFMNSSGHKANILLSDFSKGGTAVIEVNKIYYYVQLFGY